ncbi:MAG: HD domain-containing protein [Candidatus Hydrogenedentes bacterium]|nr:HD domain-containing protein [Candidatus Hydrogenedentota bacterium]
MEATSRQDSGEATRKYQPVPLASLRLYTVTDFDLYIKPNQLSAPVLYRERNLPFTGEVLDRLAESKINSLYVSDDQQDLYQRYVEDNLGKIISDESMPPVARAEILYGSAQNAVKENVRDLRSGEVLPRSENLVSYVINFMFNVEASFNHFLDVCSFDYYTYTHSVSVCTYSISLAQRLGFEGLSFLMEFGTGALLHDIGKSRIDDDILNLKGTLSEEQWQIMRQHPKWGWEFLKEHGIDSDTILGVALHHHEELRGGGYPDGLEGDEIPYYVRIVTICDIFDALMTRHSYKGAINSFPALRMMQKEMTDNLDAGYFREFISMMAGAEAQQA